MNEYKITYTSNPAVTGGTGTFTLTVVDRTEAAAKKFFRETAKELGRTFQSIELVRTDAPATKRNERETLETIRKMVAELGPQSYLATAFEGCFEIAEQNIEYDFGDSMKGRVESAEKKLAEAEKKIESLLDQLDESQKDWEAAHAAGHAIADQKDAEIKALQAQVLSPDDLEDVRQLLADRVDNAEHMATQAADDIVKYADDPAGKEFRQAVADHRNFSGTAEYYRELLGRVVAAQAAAHANPAEVA